MRDDIRRTTYYTHVWCMYDIYAVDTYIDTHIWRTRVCQRCCERPRIWHVMQCVAVCCNVLQCVTKVCQRHTRDHMFDMWCRMLQCVAMCCSVLQCVAVCCKSMSETHERPHIGHTTSYTSYTCVFALCEHLTSDHIFHTHIWHTRVWMVRGWVLAQGKYTYVWCTWCVFCTCMYPYTYLMYVVYVRGELCAQDKYMYVWCIYNTYLYIYIFGVREYNRWEAGCAHKANSYMYDVYMM